MLHGEIKKKEKKELYTFFLGSPSITWIVMPHMRLIPKDTVNNSYICMFMKLQMALCMIFLIHPTKLRRCRELTFLYFNMKKWGFMELCDVQRFTSKYVKAARSLNLSLMSPSLLSKHCLTLVAKCIPHRSQLALMMHCYHEAVFNLEECWKVFPLTSVTRCGRGWRVVSFLWSLQIRGFSCNPKNHELSATRKQHASICRTIIFSSLF